MIWKDAKKEARLGNAPRRLLIGEELVPIRIRRLRENVEESGRNSSFRPLDTVRTSQRKELARKVSFFLEFSDYLSAQMNTCIFTQRRRGGQGNPAKTCRVYLTATSTRQSLAQSIVAASDILDRWADCAHRTRKCASPSSRRGIACHRTNAHSYNCRREECCEGTGYRKNPGQTVNCGSTKAQISVAEKVRSCHELLYAF